MTWRLIMRDGEDWISCSVPTLRRMFWFWRTYRRIGYRVKL